MDCIIASLYFDKQLHASETELVASAYSYKVV